MTRIGAVCLITIGIWVVIEVVVGFVHWKHHCFAGTGVDPPCLQQCALSTPQAQPGQRALWNCKLSPVARQLASACAAASERLLACACWCV